MMGLALVVRDHDRALEYDLMTRTGRTLAEYFAMGTAGMAALVSFVRYLPPDSALARALHPESEVADWHSTAMTNAILADIYDAYCASHVKKGRKAKPYPRPGDGRGQVIGKGAIPVRDFMDWWNSN